MKKLKIEYIKIFNHKNLNDFEISFEKGSSVNALIGNNGSGKSNLLEALTIIFSKVKLGEDVEFGFKIKYMIDDNRYDISNIENGLQLKKNDENILKKDIPNAMPKTVFLYYCGETARLKELSLNYVDNDFDNAVKKGTEAVLKYITYLTVDDFGPALLANLAFENTTCKKIFDLVGIEAIHLPIILKIKKPYWGSKSGSIEDLWKARGTILDVINKFIEISNADKITTSENGEPEIVISNLVRIKEYWHSALEIFIAFKMLMQADILQSVEFNITKIDNPYIYSYMNLSEGEKQLSQLLSILEITKEYKALFLLDEFDSYLHPNWQREFVNIINEIEIRGQVIFTTHSPLTLGKMNKENIVLLKDGETFSPSADTLNRDVTEILEELMEVKKRPIEIDKLILNFRNAIVHSSRDDAIKTLEVLKTMLKESDPFFVTAKIAMGRFKE